MYMHAINRQEECHFFSVSREGNDHDRFVFHTTLHQTNSEERISQEINLKQG